MPYTLRKRDVILSGEKGRIRKTTHKSGVEVEVPRDVQHAMELDRKNGNSYGVIALALEMKNVGVAFEVLGGPVLQATLFGT